MRNVFIESERDKYIIAKEAIEAIISEHRKVADPQIHIGEKSPFGYPTKEVRVPDKHVGFIIGK